MCCKTGFHGSHVSMRGGRCLEFNAEENSCATFLRPLGCCEELKSQKLYQKAVGNEI